MEDRVEEEEEEGPNIIPPLLPHACTLPISSLSFHVGPSISLCGDMAWCSGSFGCSAHLFPAYGRDIFLSSLPRQPPLPSMLWPSSTMPPSFLLPFPSSIAFLLHFSKPLLQKLQNFGRHGDGGEEGRGRSPAGCLCTCTAHLPPAACLPAVSCLCLVISYSGGEGVSSPLSASLSSCHLPLWRRSLVSPPPSSISEAITLSLIHLYITCLHSKMKTSKSIKTLVKTRQNFGTGRQVGELEATKVVLVVIPSVCMYVCVLYVLTLIDGVVVYFPCYPYRLASSAPLSLPHLPHTPLPFTCLHF